MPKIRFSRHGRNRMRFWHLAEEDVIGALVQPDETTPNVKERNNAWKAIGEKWLRVTYIEDGGELVVVTVTVREKKGGS